ncbi:MAG: transcriptional regulator [Actinomycetia bacterium]|nr:transcriptional regulator [Actinomycetes bacterium]
MARLRVLDEVSWEGAPVPGERSQALLRALVEAGRRGLGEQALIEEIWTDDPPANPAKALQVVVSRARAATAPESIERTAHGYRLALAAQDVDAWALRPEGLRLAAEGRYLQALPLLERASEQARERASGRARPDDEVMAALLRAIAQARGVPAALERYEDYRETLADSLGVDPSPALRALHAELLARDRPVRSGLRFDADALIGRDADLAAVAGMVRAARVVSIVGVGGLGKTRLAHVVGRQAEQPVVHFVELAGVTAPDGVALAVADSLGVRESVVARNRPLRDGGGDVLARIVDAVGAAPTLLILDNCERLVAALADLVSALLARTPALRVLTTSRAPLGLAAERVYLLPELSVDDGAALFVRRATAARPGVHLDPNAVRTLVTRLDGLPLAIELAAAKVRVLSVAEIERRLDNRFALLRGGSRDAPERHQTLFAVIDWSWNLLLEQQRVALRRLSVFADGFGMDGAQAVIGPGAFESVTALVDQSLITVADADPVRFRLLETVREFGRMQLADAGDDAEAARRLREWAVGLADAAASRLFSVDQVATMARLRSEEGNLLDVLRRALADADVAAVVRIFAALTGYWTIEGSQLNVVDLVRRVEDLIVPALDIAGQDDAWRTALIFIITNRMVFSRGGADEVIARLRALGPGATDPRVQANVRVVLALVGPREPGSPPDADEAGSGRGSLSTGQLAELLSLTDDTDPIVARVALSWASVMLENTGDLAGARAAAERVLALADDSDGPWAKAVSAAQLASFAMQAGDITQARRHAAAALPLLTQLGAWDDVAQTKTMLALIAIRLGELAEAERILAEVARGEASQSIFGGTVIRLAGHAELLLARGQTDAGLAAYREAVAALRNRWLPGVDLPAAYAPWAVFPDAASIAAHCRVGRADEVRAARDELRAVLIDLLGDPDEFIDYPLLGCGLFALGVWELVAGGSREAGRELLGCAVAFAYNRIVPSLDLDWAEKVLGERVRESRPALEAREAAHAALLRLPSSTPEGDVVI